MNTDAATTAKNITRGTKAAGVRKVTLPVTDMNCAVSVESMLKAQPGVEDAGVNFANHTAWVANHPAQITLPQMRQAIQSVAQLRIRGHQQPAEREALREGLETRVSQRVKKDLLEGWES